MRTPSAGQKATLLRRAHLRRTSIWAISAVVSLAVLFLLLSQVLLPGIVAAKLRSTLRGAATDVHLSVHAAPALELLFGHADRVDLSIGELRPTGRANVKALLERTRETSVLHATVARLLTERLELDDVSVQKRGSLLVTSAAVNRKALAAALPAGITLRPTPAGSQGIAFSAHLTLLGQTIDANALLEARGGRIEIVPESSLLPSIPVFSDSQLAVDALQVAVHGADYTFRAEGHLT
jgi:hypothetical protein